MPHHKSCKKRLITARKARERNRHNKATMRGALKVYRTLPEGSADQQSQLTGMYSQLDVLARKGVIPTQRASRIKSRLAALAARSKS